jgi:hypothetical protein
MGKSKFAWRIKGEAEGNAVLVCTKCKAERFRVRSEPVKKKRHTKTGHQRRIVAVCIKCKKVKRIKYGTAPGIRKHSIT